VVELTCGPDERFQPTRELLEAALTDGPVAGLVLASPANPTGTMVDHDQLAELAGWCRDHGVRLVSDEIYHGIVDASVARRVGVGCCAWQHDRSAVIISSFSKYWGMTGWRLGWALVPDDLGPAVDALAGNYALCAPVPAQHAALEAFTERSYAEAEAAVREFAAARSLVLDAVDDLGWTKVAPADGAFYVWADIADRLGPHADSGTWCAALLDAEGVAVTPGSDFDTVGGDGAIRLSLAAGPEAVGAALMRIRRFQQGLARSGPTRS
jgi:aspartate/methionine/tyrosine aminotransferase